MSVLSTQPLAPKTVGFETRVATRLVYSLFVVVTALVPATVRDDHIPFLHCACPSLLLPLLRLSYPINEARHAIKEDIRRPGSSDRYG